MAEMADSMKPRGKRIKQLTRDTSDIIAHPCRGLVDFANHLLLEGTDFVIRGWFTSDPIEKCFEKLRQGSGKYQHPEFLIWDKTNIYYSFNPAKISIFSPLRAVM